MELIAQHRNREWGIPTEVWRDPTRPGTVVVVHKAGQVSGIIHRPFTNHIWTARTKETFLCTVKTVLADRAAVLGKDRILQGGAGGKWMAEFRAVMAAGQSPTVGAALKVACLCMDDVEVREDITGSEGGRNALRAIDPREQVRDDDPQLCSTLSDLLRGYI